MVIDASTIGILVRTPAGISSREILMDEVSVLAGLALAYGTGELSKPLLKIKMPDCDGYAEYWTYDDIPNADVPCPCGNPNHWLIKYETLK